MRKLHITDIRKSSIFHGLSYEEFDNVIASLDSQLKYYRANQVILSAGSRVRRIGLIMEGRVTAWQEDYWAQQRVYAQFKQGQIFAEAFACSRGARSNITVIALEPTVVLWFDIMDILRIDTSDVNRTELIRNIMHVIADKNLALGEKLRHLECRTTKEKLLSFLSAEAYRQGKDEFDISYDRQELADYLGIERSAMSTELSKLAKAGYYTVHKNHFVLKKK